MQSQPLLGFEANAARTGHYGCFLFAELTIWSCSKGGKKGFPQALLRSAFISLPPSFLHSVTHHWRILTKPHELLFRLSLLGFSLSPVVFCWAVVDVLHCWYESKHGFVSHTIVAMFP